MYTWIERLQEILSRVARDDGAKDADRRCKSGLTTAAPVSLGGDDELKIFLRFPKTQAMEHAMSSSMPITAHGQRDALVVYEQMAEADCSWYFQETVHTYNPAQTNRKGMAGCHPGSQHPNPRRDSTAWGLPDIKCVRAMQPAQAQWTRIASAVCRQAAETRKTQSLLAHLSCVYCWTCAVAEPEKPGARLALMLLLPHTLLTAAERCNPQPPHATSDDSRRPTADMRKADALSPDRNGCCLDYSILPVFFSSQLCTETIQVPRVSVLSAQPPAKPPWPSTIPACCTISSYPAAAAAAIAPP